MLFKTGHKSLLCLTIKTDKTFVERAHTLDYLGLTMDKHINYKNHVGNISNKCSKTLGVLNKLKHFLLINVKIMLYNSLILPHFNYGIISWGFKRDRIIKFHKKAICLINLSEYNAHTGLGRIIRPTLELLGGSPGLVFRDIQPTLGRQETEEMCSK